MRVNGTPYRTVWIERSEMTATVYLIDQNRLPFDFAVVACPGHVATARAIQEMTVRGAPAIGAAAGFALAQAFHEAQATDADPWVSDGATGRRGDGAFHEARDADADPWAFVRAARARIEATRPTARDLFFATERVWAAAEAMSSLAAATRAAFDAAQALASASVAACRAIGEAGEPLIPDRARVLTHCNAGWLACVDYGTATAPLYLAASRGKRLHVWVDETRPRSQGARLTAWELHGEGIPHRIIADNAAASLMSRGEVDLVIVGADRIAANGDVANKIGTLEKALCAREFGIPFYVAAPHSTFDPRVPHGKAIPIEERSPDEVLYQTGPDESGMLRRIRVAAPGSSAFNPAFDVTPAHLITGIITERGVLRRGV
ncbi:MAG: S-methyl-5-thioribose-1-phosphate isomerase [Chloroflexi bacterium]|nr:S-methyl-5-thioribose-1-phosphate isomerase [Chloroflexota bacterium]